MAILHAAMIAQSTRGQAPIPAAVAPIVTLSPIAPDAQAVPSAMTISPQPTPTAPRKALARLVRNPDPSDRLPPFALADQFGTIQRYVEPVPQIDLEPYIGSVVTVRHDTGPTLLATQLEFPPHPVDGAMRDGPSSRPPSASHLDPPGVRRAGYDEDDMSVDLLPEDDLEVALPPADGLSTWDEELPLGDGPALAEPLAGRGGEGRDFEHAARCPHCGDCRPTLDNDPTPRWRERKSRVGPLRSAQPCRIFAGVELNFMRLHLLETPALGKLSEKYDLSPRITVGFEGAPLVDGRVRYWNYGRTTPILSGDFAGGGVRFDMDVVDFEAIRRFRGHSSDVVLSMGLRLAKIEIADALDRAIANDLVGMTLAADARTHLLPIQAGKLNWAYGGRLSILGGDWGGDIDSSFLAPPARDDNVVVHELYAGLEYCWRYEQVDLHARAVFEMQNWRTDALGQDAGNHSIGFLGPGIQMSARY